jgi:hypothetical protein
MRFIKPIFLKQIGLKRLECALHYHIGHQEIMTLGANIEINKRIQNKRMKSMGCMKEILLIE